MQQNPKYISKFYVKSNWTINAGIRHLRDEREKLRPCDIKMSLLVIEHVFSTPDPTKTTLTVVYPNVS